MIVALLMPLLGGIAAYAVGRKRAAFVATTAVIIGFLFALRLIVQETVVVFRWDWMPGIELGWHLDTISLILIGLVYFISLLVHLFSVFYMHGSPGMHRYFFKLGFFTSSMLALLAADHLILLFIFWELVGFSSYLLIGFWFQDRTKSRLAREAFMINRVADAGLLVGVILMVVVLDIPYLSEMKDIGSGSIIQLAGFCLVMGALGKSAQFPFFGWLPKAMAGPTPVSALIHAATMVAAGVYLLIRLVPFLTPQVLTFVAFTGSLTAIVAAYAALTQHDIKKVLAFSTISQLGYMVMGVGVGAYQASLFHLWTHAFFKAGLFLAAGSVIHFMHMVKLNSEAETQDMRNMGGLVNKLPVTAAAFIICGLALSGLPFFSGFLSKEGILSGAWIWALQTEGAGSFIAYLILVLAFIAAILTPLYIGRQVLLVFFGAPRQAIGNLSMQENTLTLKLPLILLAVGSVWFFNALSPFDASGWWLNHYLFALDIIERPSGYEFIEQLTLGLSILLSLAGLLIAFYYYRPGGSRQIRYSLSSTIGRPWYYHLSQYGWFINDFYGALNAGYLKIAKFARETDRKVIDPTIHFIGVGFVVGSKFLGIVDREIVDGLVNLTAWISGKVGILLSRVQSARVQTQITWMVLAIVFIVIWFQLGAHI